MKYHLILLLSICFIYLIYGEAPSNRKKCVVFMSLCLCLFYSLRSWSVGSDTIRYYANFVYASDLSFSEIWSHYEQREPFFYSFCKVISLLANDPQFFVAVVGAIICSSFAYFAYHQKGNVLLMYILFITLRVFPFMMSGFRQAIAMSILLVSYVFMQQGKKKLYLIGSSLAFLFHTSSFIVPFVVYGSGKLKRKGLIPFVCILMGLIVISTGDVFSSVIELLFGGEKYMNYAGETKETFRLGGTFLLYLIMFVLIMCQKKNLSRMVERFDLELCVISFAMMFTIMSLTIPNVFRMTYYFLFPMFSMVTFLIVSIFGNKNKKSIILIFVLLLITQYMVLGTGADVDDYELFWDNPYMFTNDDMK